MQQAPTGITTNNIGNNQPQNIQTEKSSSESKWYPV
jgi:hypothetical protein